MAQIFDLSTRRRRHGNDEITEVMKDLREHVMSQPISETLLRACKKNVVSMTPAWADEYADHLWLDVEASALHAGSYPIEIGWCGADLAPVAFLIKPQAKWTIDDWAPDSERIHGISRAHLFEFGFDAHDVANWLNAACTGKIVLSDNPAYDGDWLTQLYHDTGIEQDFELQDGIDVAGEAAFFSQLSQSDVDSYIERIKRKFPHPHRAGPDVRRAAAQFLVLAMPHELDAVLAMA